jgi:peptidoglycan/LPS O-acetylase OafA/YrhL
VFTLVFLLTYSSAYGVVPLLLLTVFFVLVAAGNSLFGSLLSPASRTLGELAYGIYLLHGLTLFVLFNFVLGMSASRELTAVQHWALICAATPLLILACMLAFRWIERPFMQQTASLTAWVRKTVHLLIRG